MVNKGLNGNQLKLVALLAMTADHVGMMLFPQVIWWRLVGRLAYPIYAYLVAEGCLHTRSMAKYLASMASMALLCQVVYLVAMGSLYQCILVTFSLSIGLCMLLKKAKDEQKPLWYILFTAAVAAVWFLTEELPLLLSGTDYAVDYGFLGVILPVALYLVSGKVWKLLLTAAVLVLMSLSSWVQFPSVLAVTILALYNGTRGNRNLKRIFYWYYPVHLVVIYGISLL